jgi:hypothetical protein
MNDVRVLPCQMAPQVPVLAPSWPLAGGVRLVPELQSLSATVRGPSGDHTACAMVRGTTLTARSDLGDSVRDVRGRVAKRPGGQGVVGSNPAVPTQVKGLIQNSDRPFLAFWGPRPVKLPVSSAP